MWRIFVIVGGTFQPLARHPAVAAADRIIYADVPSELAVSRACKGVRLLALSSGQTLGTLLGENDSKRLHALYATRPGINLDLGMGQLPAIGKLAGEKVTADQAFDQFLESEVFDPLFILHNGAIVEVEIAVPTSGSGGQVELRRTGPPLTRDTGLRRDKTTWRASKRGGSLDDRVQVCLYPTV